MIGLFWTKIMYSVDSAVLASQKTKQDLKKWKYVNVFANIVACNTVTAISSASRSQKLPFLFSSTGTYNRKRYLGTSFQGRDYFLFYQENASTKSKTKVCILLHSEMQSRMDD